MSFHNAWFPVTKDLK